MSKGPRKGANLLSAPRKDFPSFIFIDETINKFGWDPRLLKDNSGRLVVTNCAKCGDIREKCFRSAMNQRLCLDCSNKINAADSAADRSDKMKLYYFNGGKHPLKDVGHSQKTKDKMSIDRKGKKLNLSKETRASLAKHCIKNLHTEKAMKAQREAVKILSSGPNNHRYGKPPAHTKKLWHKKVDGTEVCFRSTWEQKFAVWLERENIQWQYEHETFQVEYILKEKLVKGTYTPDFKCSKTFYEVKGRWDEIGLAKFNAFISQYPKLSIKVIDREWLTGKGLL